VAWKILLAVLVAAMTPAVAFGRPTDTGIITICNAAGPRPATGTFTFTLVTVASAGGTTTLNIAVGTCASRIFYPLGVNVTVTESVPPSNVVTGIKLTTTIGKAGTTSVISSSTPTAGTATVTVGTGDATLTFTTSSKTGPIRIPCSVPNVFGLTLTAATTSLRKAHCTVGVVRKVSSNIYYPGVVYSQRPPRGTVLAPKAPVNLTVSLGHP
jgi:hypothetical protein